MSSRLPMFAASAILTNQKCAINFILLPNFTVYKCELKKLPSLNFASEHYIESVISVSSKISVYNSPRKYDKHVDGKSFSKQVGMLYCI